MHIFDLIIPYLIRFNDNIKEIHITREMKIYTYDEFEYYGKMYNPVVYITIDNIIYKLEYTESNIEIKHNRTDYEIESKYYYELFCSCQ